MPDRRTTGTNIQRTPTHAWPVPGNHLPEFIDLPVWPDGFSVTERAAVGTVSAYDPDGDRMKFCFLDEDECFGTDRNTGAITVIKKLPETQELDWRYRLGIEASDGRGGFEHCTVGVSVMEQTQ